MLQSYSWDGIALEISEHTSAVLIKQNIRAEKVFVMTMGERSFQNSQKCLQLSEERLVLVIIQNP